MVTQESLNHWARCGCVELEFGGESAVDYVLNKSNKTITRTQIRKAFEMAKNAGICVHTNWMVGLPGETSEAALETIDFVYEATQKGIIDTMDYYIMVPYPGSLVAATPSNYGIRILNSNWVEYNEDLLPVFESQTFPRQEIYDIWMIGNERFVEVLS